MTRSTGTCPLILLRPSASLYLMVGLTAVVTAYLRTKYRRLFDNAVLSQDGTEPIMSRLKFLSGGLALALAAAPVQASPVIINSQAHLSDVTATQWHGRGWGYRGWGYRGGYYGGYHRGGGWGSPWPFIGFGAAVVAGAIIADQAYRPHPGHYYDEGLYDGPYYYPADFHGDPREICLQNFRTFEWRTGLYTTASGQKRLCPYLRDVGPPPPPPPADRPPY
jgi:hypothetical protein